MTPSGPSTWLIPEGSKPTDPVIPWKRCLPEIAADNPWAAIERMRSRGIEIESFWVLEDLWVAGYDRAEALEESLVWCGSSAVEATVCWNSCKLKWADRSWQGRLDTAINEALGLNADAGPEGLFSALGNAPEGEGSCPW